MTAGAIAGLLMLAEPAGAASLLVVCQGSDEVGVVDTRQLALVRRIAVPPAPAAIALAPDGASAFVTHPDAGRVTRIDVARSEVVASVAIGGQPFGIVADPDGRWLYVGDWSGDRVLRLETATLAQSATTPVGRAPAGLALDSHRRELYSADRESGTISIVDLDGFARTMAVPVGEGPYSFDATHDPHQLRVVNVRSGDVAEMDKESRAVVRHPVGKMPYGVASMPVSGDVLVANQQSGSLSLLTTGAARTLKVGGSPEAVKRDPARALAYVTDWFSDQLLVVDLEAFRVRTRIAVCRGPRSLALVP